MAGIDGLLVGHFRYDPNHGFVGMVALQNEADKSMTILTVGVEASEFDILTWIKDTINLMRQANATNVQAPDMYDRMPKHFNS